MRDTETIHIVASYQLTDVGFNVVTAMDGFIERVIKTEVNLMEQGITAALIALGWTPPDEKENKNE